MEAAQAEPSFKPAKAEKKRAPEPAMAEGTRSHKSFALTIHELERQRLGRFLKPKANGHRDGEMKDDVSTANVSSHSWPIPLRTAAGNCPK